MIPVKLRDQKAIEAARFVRAKVSRMSGADPDDVFQEAVLWALEWAERYGGDFEGNPFTPMARVGFTRAGLAAARARHTASITEHGLRSGWPIWAPVQIADCGGHDDDESAVQLPDMADGGQLRLAGEAERRGRVARLLGSLQGSEQRLVRLATGDHPPPLRALAERCGLSRKQARRLLRRLAHALGRDPTVAHARAGALDPRLPKLGSVVRRRIGDREVECRIGADGLFEYAGRRYPSLSAAALDASRDAGRPRVAVNGFEFWGLLGSPRVISRTWKPRKSAAAGTRAATSPPTTRATACTPLATSPSLKPRKQSAAQRPASTCGSGRTAAACRG